MKAQPLARQLNVLLVDDCVAERDLYQLALEPEFHILTAARGLEGVAIAVRHHPDAIVLDVMMPGFDGWETCARIKSNVATADIPVLFLTGEDADDLVERGSAAAAWTVLHKPCSGDTLRSAILAATCASGEEPRTN